MKFSNLSMKNQLISMSFLIFLTTTLIYTFLMEWQMGSILDGVIEVTNGILIQESKRKLDAVEELQLKRIERYFSNLHEKVDLLSRDESFTRMTKGFIGAYQSYLKERKVIGADFEKMKRELHQYYDVVIDGAYSKLNEEGYEKLEKDFSMLSDTAVTLQYDYLLKNPYEMDQKSQFKTTGLKTTYDQIHDEHHSHLGHDVRNLDLDEVYLVDAVSGEVVYVSSKNITLGTSLVSGPYSRTHLGECFRKLVTSKKENKKSILIDFDSFEPALGKAMAFIGASLFEGDRVVGTLIFGFSIHRVSEKMLDVVGFGESGESYLVGQDRLPRSDLLKSQQADISQVFIYPKESQLNTDAVKKALEGESGCFETVSYRGVETLTSYSPLEIDGLSWGLITEIEKAEIYQGMNEMHAKVDEKKIRVLLTLIVAGIVSLVLVIYAIKFLVTFLELPIRRVAASCGMMAENARKMSGELAQVSSSNIQMGSVIREIAISSENTSRSASKTVDIANSSEASILELGQEANKISEVLEVIQEIAEKTDLLALNASIEAATAGESGKGFSVVATEVQQLANKTAEAAENITEKIFLIQEQLKVNISKIQEVAEANQEIEEATASLASAIEEMSLTIDNVNNSTNSTSDLTSDVTTEIMEVREEMSEILHGRKQS